MDYKDNQENIINELKDVGADSLLNYKKRYNLQDIDLTYFDQLQNKVLSQNLHHRTARVIMMRYGLTIAAGIILLLGVLAVLDRSQSMAIDELSDQDILAYLENIEYLDHNDLYTLTEGDDSLVELNAEENEELIIDYIYDNLDDIEMNDINFE